MKLRVPIKFKVFGLVASLVFFALAMILFQASRVFKSDKEDFVKELSARLASSTGKNIADKIANIQDKLVVFISSKESLAHTGARVQDQNMVLYQRYQEFLSIALMTTNSNDDLKLSWVIRNPYGDANKLPPSLEKDFLSEISIKPAKQNKRWFWKTQTPDGQWIMALGFSVDVVDRKEAAPKKKKGAAAAAPIDEEPKTTTAWIFGFLPASVVQDMLQDFSTGINSGLILDEKGVVIAASDSKQRWKNLSAHPVVAEIMKNSRPAGTGDYIDLDEKPIIGSFENIPKLNMGVVVTTPRDKAFEAAGVLVRNIIFIGVIVLFAAIGTAIILSNYMTKPLQKLAKIAARIGAGDFSVPVDVKTNDEIGDLAGSFAVMEQNLIERDAALDSSKQALLQSEKMSAFGQLSAGIAHEVKNPLAGILGHAQLAMGKIQNDDIKKHLEVIEKETRRCKAIVENLMKFARAEKVTLESTNLAQVCQDTINLVEHQLTLAGCKIFKDFQPCPMVLANSNQLQQVLLNLMVNASHAMENCAKKHVIVRTLQANGKAQIQVEDTGAGMPPEVQKKIFEPFFTTKPAGKGTGLGLSVSIGIVKDHKGEIYTKSEINQGTTFFIDIPIPEGAKMPEKPLESTHGGTYLTSDAKALEDAKIHEQKISRASEQKPTDLQKDISAKQIDKALDDFDVRKSTAGKADLKAQAEAKSEVKPEVQTSAKVEPKPEIKVEAPKSEVKPEVKAESKPENKSGEFQVKIKRPTMGGVKPAEPAPVAKAPAAVSAPAPVPAVEAKSVAASVPVAETKPAPAPVVEVKPVPAVEVKPTPVAEVKPAPAAAAVVAPPPVPAAVKLPPTPATPEVPVERRKEPRTQVAGEIKIGMTTKAPVPKADLPKTEVTKTEITKTEITRPSIPKIEIPKTTQQAPPSLDGMFKKKKLPDSPAPAPAPAVAKVVEPPPVHKKADAAPETAPKPVAAPAPKVATVTPVPAPVPTPLKIVEGGAAPAVKPPEPAKKADVGDFQVKIKRPKLKV